MTWYHLRFAITDHQVPMTKMMTIASFHAVTGIPVGV